MTIENEIHDVRKILQDQVAKLAVLERDYGRLKEDYTARGEQIAFLEKSLEGRYRTGVLEGLTIAEYVLQVDRGDATPLEAVRDMLDKLTQEPHFCSRFIQSLLTNFIKEVTKVNVEQRDDDPVEIEPLEEEPKPLYSITGKPLP